MMSIASFSAENVFAPNCTSDGNFHEVQCDKNGICWCVDQDGNEIENTKSMTKPVCPKRMFIFYNYKYIYCILC